MLSRLLPRSLPPHFRTLTLTLTLASSSSHPNPYSPSPVPNPKPKIPTALHSLCPFSSSSSSNGGDWKFSPETDDIASIFRGKEDPAISGVDDIAGGGDTWLEEEEKGDIFEGIDKELAAAKGGGGDGEWETADGYEPWSLGDGGDGDKKEEAGERMEAQMELERKEGDLLATLKGQDSDFSYFDSIIIIFNLSNLSCLSVTGNTGIFDQYVY